MRILQSHFNKVSRDLNLPLSITLPDRLKSASAARLNYSCDKLDSIPFRNSNEKHIMFIFHKAEPHGTLHENFQRCVDSIFKTTLKPLKEFRCHVIGDSQSFRVAKDVFKDIRLKGLVKLEHHNNAGLQDKALPLLTPLLQSLSAKKHRFSDPLFFISTVLHRFLPRNISRLVLLDVDLVFKSDIAGLFAQFDDFTETQAVGIARENQPVYQHVFRKYRLSNPGTKIGEPPPDGLTGVNSGVLLLDLDKLRCSQTYNSMFLPEHIPSLVSKYMMQAHLGDQDFYTLLQLEQPQLLHILPCGWNRQLCQWWRMEGLESAFDLFYKCEKPIHVLHGNCKTNLTSAL
ncbi:xyloside xylosyltransferase 1-like [Plakobranchus ocellatus]|uniref:Xyloside xylosyltransferase 1-like n=1 Tax=Plakobranchus ocellatus TaxID=259542 RepID=A0AAV3ZKD1_9GAST|nr:xyloside xylosyltransferase 1-like [Plakobranchus ocellatus]